MFQAYRGPTYQGIKFGIFTAQEFSNNTYYLIIQLKLILFFSFNIFKYILNCSFICKIDCLLFTWQNFLFKCIIFSKIQTYIVFFIFLDRSQTILSFFFLLPKLPFSSSLSFLISPFLGSIKYFTFEQNVKKRHNKHSCIFALVLNALNSSVKQFFFLLIFLYNPWKTGD